MSNSKLYPGIAGAIKVPMTGTITIDTGMKDLLSFSCNQMTDVVANEEAILTWSKVNGGSEVLIKSWKHGTNTGVAGDSEILISWTAIGNR